MPSPALVYSLFIASPADIINERKYIYKAVLNWNKIHGRAKGIRIDVLEGTDAFPIMDGQRAQVHINEQLVYPADILVALFGTRFGTPTGTAGSGTEEEILESMVHQKPVMLYFNEGKVSHDVFNSQESLDQIRRVKDFKTKHGNDGLYKSYKSGSEFEEQFRNDLSLIMNNLTIRNLSERRHDVQEFHHINLAVSNLKNSIDFYCDRLRLRLIKRAPFRFGGAWFGLPNGQHLHLVEKPGLKREPDALPKKNDLFTPPSPHFALRVENEI